MHTFVRLSPDLLGYYTVRGILDINGYDDVVISKERIDSEASYDDIKPALSRLQFKAWKHFPGARAEAARCWN